MKYSKDQLRALKLPATLISAAQKAGTKTVGTHHASGARVYQNVYTVWSIVRGNVRDQISLDRFLSICAKRGFNLDAIPGLDAELEHIAREYALAYKGVQYRFPDTDLTW
jgi:hypothetical protein